MVRGDDNDVKDQELQIKIQENERLQREVSDTNSYDENLSKKGKN